MTRILVLLALWMVAALALSAVEDLSAMVATADPAVVTVESGATEGTGVIINPQGFLLTNCHVVGHAHIVSVELASRQTFAGTVRFTDAHLDLAVIELPVHNLPVMPLGDSNALKRGQVVAALGSPLGVKHTVTEGIVSGLDVPVNGQTYIQTDTPLNPGSSGGPLLDAGGHMVGIVTMVEKGAVGVGFAIPIRRAEDVLEQQGIAVITDLNAQGVALQSTKSSPASRRSTLAGYSRLTPMIIGVGALLVGMLCGVLLAGMFKRRRPRARVADRGADPEIIFHNEANVDIDIELH